MGTDSVISALRHIVVMAHPDPKSYTAQVARTYCDTVAACGQTAILRDLHAMQFDPVLHADERASRTQVRLYPDVAEELAVIANCDVLVLVYPIWFGSAPAMLKGYVDRVLGAGVSPAAVQAREGSGLLNGARLISFTSSAAREPWLAEQGQEMALRDVFDHYIERGFGMRSTKHFHFGGVVEGFSERFVRQNLYDVNHAARVICADLAAERHKAEIPVGHASQAA
jgi:NAD(P)H dehydrogenase (quinone)